MDARVENTKREMERVTREAVAESKRAVQKILTDSKEEGSFCEEEKSRSHNRPGIALTVELTAEADAQDVFERVSSLILALDEYDQSFDGPGLILDIDRSAAEPGLLKLMIVTRSKSIAAEPVRIHSLEKALRTLPTVIKVVTGLAA